jgi:hypothetical protein
MPKGYGRAHYTKPNVWDKALDLEVYRGGEKLDPGVNYFVLMMDQMGLETTYSCEGHPDGFYVTFYGPYEAALSISRVGYFTVEVERQENYWSIRWKLLGEPPVNNKVDAMRWAAQAWEEKLGPLDFSSVNLST